MVQTVTAEMLAALTARKRKFRGRVAIGTGGTVGGCYGLMDVGLEGSVDATIVVTPGSVSTRWRLLLRTQLMPQTIINVHADNPTGGSVVKTLQLDADNAYLGNYSPGPPIDTFDITSLDFGGRVYVAVQIDADGEAHAKLWAYGSAEPGGWQLEGNVDIVTSVDYTGPTLNTLLVHIGGDDNKQLEIHELAVAIDGGAMTVIDDFQRDPDPDGFGGDWTTDPAGADASATIVCRVSRPPLRISVDRTRRLAAAQLDADFTNEEGEKGYYTQAGADFVPNAPVQAFMWYEDPANEVCVFTGLVDRVTEHRDPRTVSITARSRMKWLIEQVFIATAPNDPEETGAVLTEANGVYVNQTIEYIVGDILDRGGWPTADRVIASTGITVASFTIPDLTSWAEAITGTDRLAAVAGFDFWEDELGFVHFEPSPLTEVTEPSSDYTFEAGVDIMALDHETDDVDRKTRLRVTGPMTSLAAAWTETWETTILTYPVGVWHDPADPDSLYVITSLGGDLVRLRQSDRTIAARYNLEPQIDYYAGGLSGDPSDSSIFWVLDIDWANGPTQNARIKKFDKTSHAVLDDYVLPDGQWSDLKSDGVDLWLTNYGTDRLYKRDINDGSAIASWAYPGHTNPTGMYLAGTTIGLFFDGEARFRLVSTSAPGTITGTQSTAGTHIAGGEIDTVTDTDLYAVARAGLFGSSAGHVWKFSLATEVVNDVVATAAVADLEDELGEQSGIAPRDHDLHPTLDPHPYEIRLLDVQLKVVTSTAQAQAAAEAMLIAAQRLHRTLDVAWVGNPAVQINDVLEIIDPVSDLPNPWVLDTYRAEMVGGGLYVGSGSLLPWESPVEVEGGIENPDDEEEGGGDGEGEGDEDVPPGEIPPPGGGGNLLDKDFIDGILDPFIKQTYPNDNPGDPMIEYGLFDESMVTVHDGYVDIRAVRQLDDSYLQGFIATFDADAGPDPVPTFDFQYGTVRAVMRMNTGQGAWQGFWLLISDSWDSPEVDWPELISDMYTANVHGSSNDGQHASETPFDAAEWHEYAIEKTATDIVFYIDAVEVGRATGANMSANMALMADAKLGPPGTAPDGTTPDSLYLHISTVRVDVDLPGLYISPTGDDTTGDGSIGNPWATMQKFVDSSPAAGATLYVRGGDYPYVDDQNPGFRNARDTWPSLIGTADDPITIKAYPGETVNITGATGPVISLGPNDTSHTIGTNHVVIDGLNFPDATADDAALIVVGGFDATGYYTKNVTIRNCSFSLQASEPLTSHCVGIIHGVDGYTVEDCVFGGAVSSGGSPLVMYSGPDPLNGLVQRCAFENWAIAIQVWGDDSTATIQVLHNTFKDNDSAVDLRHHSTALVRDNVFSGANSGSISIYDPNDSADTTQDHNYFSVAIGARPGYALPTGSPAIGGALDGSDAGAYQT